MVEETTARSLRKTTENVFRKKMAKVFDVAVLIVYRRLVKSCLLSAKGDTEQRSPARQWAVAFDWILAKITGMQRENSPLIFCSTYISTDFLPRLSCVHSQRLSLSLEHFFFSKDKKTQIDVTDQQQFILDIGAKSSISDFCFSSKGHHFLLWRNRSVSLAKRPQSREVLRLRNFFAHYTKVVGCFWANAAVWIHPVSHFCRCSSA